MGFRLEVETRTQAFYLREIFKALRRLKALLEELKREPSRREYIQGIRQSAQSIRDLAMIHGFDGVEKIAGKIASTFARVLRSSVALEPQFVTRVESAVLAIKQIAEVEDTLESQMSIDRICRKIQFRQQKVQDCATKVAQNLDCIMNRQIEIVFEEPASLNLEAAIPDLVHVAAGPIFEIKEFDSVLSLLEKSEIDAKTMDLFDNVD